MAEEGGETSRLGGVSQCDLGLSSGAWGPRGGELPPLTEGAGDMGGDVEVFTFKFEVRGGVDAFGNTYGVNLCNPEKQKEQV